MHPRDTTLAAHRAQVEWYRRISPAERVALAATMSDEVRAVSRSGIQARHPEYSPEQVRLALLRLVLGDDLFRRALPDAPLFPP